LKTEHDRLKHYYFHGPSSQFYNYQRTKRQRYEDKHNFPKTDQRRRALVKRKRRPDKIVTTTLSRLQQKRLLAAKSNFEAEKILHTDVAGYMETENEMERTDRITQRQLKIDSTLNERTQRNIFDLRLTDYAPYKLNFDRSGRYGIILGRGGHVSLLDSHKMALNTEFYVNETCYDATFLHNWTMFAVAQKKNVFIYDTDGVEIHRLDPTYIFKLEFLHYHWLIGSIGHSGQLYYQDSSSGQMISRHLTKSGPCNVMKQNPTNAVIHCGHMNGTVTLWSPASSQYLVKLLCHKGAPIKSLAIDSTGTYMVTGGGESQVKIWDLRMYKELHQYWTIGGPPVTMDISQKSILGIGHGCRTTFWPAHAYKTKLQNPYMTHDTFASNTGSATIETLRFRAFEDVCGLGHSNGMSSIVIPGSGEANLDSMEYSTDPYQDTKQRHEAEIRSLLEKLHPHTIAVDSDFIGTVKSQQDIELKQAEQKEQDINKKSTLLKKKRQRGRSKISKQLARKSKNVIDAGLVKLKELRDREAKKIFEVKKRSVDFSIKGEAHSNHIPVALKRFFK